MWKLGLAALLVFASGCDRDTRKSVQKVNEGIELYKNGQFTQAEKALMEATEILPENHQAWYTLAQMRYEDAKGSKQKTLDAARDAASNALKHKDDDPMYHLLLARCYIDAKKPNNSQAKGHLETAIKLEPRLYRAQYLLGVVHDRLGDAEMAAKQWTKAAALAPTVFGKPFNALGILYIRWGLLDQAVQTLSAGIGKVTDVEALADLHYHLGFALAGQNKHKEAVEQYTASLTKRKGSAEALRQRGASYYALKDADNAKKDLEKFLSMQGKGGNPVEIQSVNQMLFSLATAPE